MVRIKVCTRVEYGLFAQKIQISFSVQNRWLLVELLPTATTMGSTTTSVLDPVPSTRVWKSSTIFHAIKQSVILNFGDAGWGAVGVSLSGKQFSFELSLLALGRF